jgi:hypothetical protein
MSQFRALLVYTGLLLFILGFQNCSDGVSFGGASLPVDSPLGTVNGDSNQDPQWVDLSDTDNDSLGVNLTDDGFEPNLDNSDNTDMDANTVVTLVPNNDQLLEPISIESCQNFLPIEDLANGSAPIRLPNRWESSTCYYKKLVDEFPNRPSGSEGEERATDVLSSNHNGDFATYISPFIVGEGTVSVLNLKQWRIALTGAPDRIDRKMKIDNFFLVQLSYMIGPARTEYISAFGTADAEPKGDGDVEPRPILLNNEPVPLVSFAPGGTAEVEVVNLTPPSQVTDDYGGPFELRLRALDCGGSAAASDVYVIFH